MRIFVSLITALVALFAGAWAIALGVAGEQFQSSAQDIWASRKKADLTGQPLNGAELAEMEQETLRALSLAPAHGQLWLTQFFIARTARQTPEGAVMENEALADQSIRAALVRQPHSPIVWAEYALLADRRHSEGKLEGGANRLGQIIQRALILGPREPNMMLVMLDLGLRNWDELDINARNTLEQAVSRLNSPRRDTAIAIALRRGRAAELCGMTTMRSHRGCVQAAPAVITPVPGVTQ